LNGTAAASGLNAIAAAHSPAPAIIVIAIRFIGLDTIGSLGSACKLRLRNFQGEPYGFPMGDVDADGRFVTKLRSR
jgi:hypothetical protein